MRVRALTFTLLTICLKTLSQGVSAEDNFPVDLEELEDSEGDLASNSTWEEYDDYGVPIKVSSSKAKSNGDSTQRPGLEPGNYVTFKEDVELRDIIASESEAASTEGVKTSPRREDDDCGDPPSVEHAKIVGGKQLRYTVGDVVSYACEFGYTTGGSVRTSQCFLSESINILKWREPQIVCIPRSCGDPGFVANAHRVGSLFTFPNRVSFECDEGYELKGKGIRYCQTSGEWSGILPTCEKIFCNLPVHPENGRVSYSSLEFGSELKYECDNGFLLKSHQPRVCSANGTWSGDEPLCKEAQCDPPVAPEHGSVQVVGGKSSVDSMAIYTCNGGRILVGSATSKCLDIGQWTFPTPKCREPCAVPDISHGKIGKYESHYRRKRFKELSEGTKIEDGAELYLVCEPNYEPMGRTDLEKKIFCSRGEWTETPRCEPASCRIPPPQTEHGRQTTHENHHGAGVVYQCLRYATKTAYGNVTCHFGSWRGITPVCKDNRCDTESLSFPGIQKERKRFYPNGQSFLPTCEKGYTTAKQNNILTCKGGKWDGHFPPCSPANCLTDPPPIENGEVDSSSVFHSSVVSYKCDEFFQMRNSGSKVQCLFGEWKGALPFCQDSRCYLKDVKKIEGVSSNTQSVTYSGDHLPVICSDGFIETGIEPTCSRGSWTETGAPCKERDCSVYSINRGRFIRIVRRTKCNTFGFNCRTVDNFEEIGRGTTKPPGSSLYINCDSRNTFQGKGENNVVVKCNQGKWYPNPACLITGMAYHEEKQASPINGQDIASKKVIRTTTERTQAPPTTPQPDMNAQIAGKNPNCSCMYQTADANLVAYAGTELVTSGTMVKNNCTLKLHCSPLGFYHLSGPTEITCENCRNWHSSEYPDCKIPQRGNTIIEIHDNDHKDLPGGILGIKQGTLGRFICIANGVANYPIWRTPDVANLNIYNSTFVDEQSYIHYSSVVELNSASPSQNGLYQCALKGYRPTSIELQVMTSLKNCSKFDENGDLYIDYDKGQAVNSSALFSCKKPNQVLDGPRVLTCLANGQWSGEPPQCILRCPELKETEGMSITYTPDLMIDSKATFHCFSPHVRSGVSFTKCKRNGEWADPMPSCNLPSCPLDNLFKVVPENVVPVMEDVSFDTLPYNFTLRLTCDNNLKLAGSQTAKCGKDGLWEVSKVQCIAGCPALERSEDSELIVEPDKFFYRIGEFVTLSCAPGLVLSTEVVRLMCLNGVWSESEVPHCQQE